MKKKYLMKETSLCIIPSLMSASNHSTTYKAIIIILVMCLLTGTKLSHAQWVKMPGTLYESTISSLSIDPNNAEVIYAGCAGRLYQTIDGGKKWKVVLNLKIKDSLVNDIQVDAKYSDIVMIGTDEGAYVSYSRGTKWKRIFHRIVELEDIVSDVFFELEDNSLVMSGTKKGLFYSQDKGTTWQSVALFRDLAIHQIEKSNKNEDMFYVATTNGLYRGNPAKGEWNLIYPILSNDEVGEEDEIEGNAQLEIENIPVNGKFMSFLVSQTNPNQMLLLHEKSLFKTNDSGDNWSSSNISAISGIATNKAISIKGDLSKSLIPTAKGVYFCNYNDNQCSEINWGLPSAGIYDVEYDAHNDILIAATDKGLYEMSYPETSIYLHTNVSAKKKRLEEVLSYFGHEPTIQELQQKAIEYAEVNPDKIKEWRDNAARKAWVPSLNVGFDKGVDETIELDRGGTNDPDTFIIGPEETDNQWSIDLQWDLSELIWNPVQTSIDNRSKLMVQLREGILNELNHLYYARRRLQIESILSPTNELELGIDRELQIQQYTAGIDALTGGYFSRIVNNYQDQTKENPQSEI